MFRLVKGGTWLFLILMLVPTSLTFADLRPSEAEAAPSPPQKKFALLVGINDYVKEGLGGIPDLTAPENDVALIKDLLVNRFEFSNDTDHIKVLLSRQATRSAIISAFEAHLIRNAEVNNGATVVFYFSGHGSQTADKNHDEGDGIDETIVPADGRIAGVYDIIDDEINELFERLSVFTSNITFIIDSCHSGTITKSVDDDLVAKEIAPDPRPQPDQKPVSRRDATAKDLGNGVLDRNRSYVTIAGCLPEQKSYEGTFSTFDGSNTTRRYSALTYFLVQKLKTVRFAANPTYREVMDIVSKAVTERYAQTPQVEGDIGRPMFGGAADAEDPFIKIIGVAPGTNVTGTTFRIGAGSAHGLEAGGVLAVYKPDARKLVGETDKLTNARVKEVSDFTAVAELPAPPATPIPGTAKVAIVTPSFGKLLRVAIALDLTGPKVSAARDDEFLIGVRSRLTSIKVVEVANITSPAAAANKTWDIALVKGPFQEIKKQIVPAAGRSFPADDAVVYFLSRRGNTYPMFGIWAHPATADGPQRMAKAIENAAKQDRLRTLVNASSPLNGKLKVEFIRIIADVNPDCSLKRGPDGKPVIIREEVIPAEQGGAEVFSLAACHRFRLRIENLSDKNLNVTLFALGTSGSITIISPGRISTFVPINRDFKTDVFYAGPPLGPETYKVIATAEETDFSFVEIPGAKQLGDYSPLDLLLDRAVWGGSKDPLRENSLKQDSWTTAHFDIDIRR